MSIIRLIESEFDENSISMFWNTILVNGFKDILLNLNSETGTLEGIEKDWLLKRSMKLSGVTLCASQVLEKWECLASSEISDEEYERDIMMQGKVYLNMALAHKPLSINIVQITLDNEYCN